MVSEKHVKEKWTKRKTTQKPQCIVIIIRIMCVFNVKSGITHNNVNKRHVNNKYDKRLFF